MAGALNIQLDTGTFLKAEPGVGRLLGVLSLQSLPRRLLLDFRDVFAEGFTFDGVTGDVKIAAGVAKSDNIRIRGLQAAVLVDGSTDLAAETQKLRVVVVPEVSAGGASLAYAAINPAIALGAFLAQLILSRPMPRTLKGLSSSRQTSSCLSRTASSTSQLSAVAATGRPLGCEVWPARSRRSNSRASPSSSMAISSASKGRSNSIFSASAVLVASCTTASPMSRARVDTVRRSTNCGSTSSSRPLGVTRVLMLTLDNERVAVARTVRDFLLRQHPLARLAPQRSGAFDEQHA